MRAAPADADVVVFLDHDGHGRAMKVYGVGDGFCLYGNSIDMWLACPEGNDAPDRIVRRHADGHAISGNNLDTEAAHAAAELSEHFVAGITLDPVKPPAVHRDNGALHIDQVVLAQTASVPFC